jgi:ABC-2 type transport system ATP-binding protein
MVAIECDGLEKEFGSVTALRGVDLTVEEGEIFGFLGPNGAGKSTTIDVLLDFVRPTAGTATVLGHDAQAESAAVRQRTGVLPEGFSAYERLTARQHVRFAAESKGVEEAVEPVALLERVGLAAAADRQAGGFSKGMSQRLALAMALVGEPDLLLLDEPTAGLDPHGARQLRELIRRERDRGATVFFSSHVLGQVEAVCDRIAILENGRIETVERVDDLRAATGTEARLEVTVERAREDALAAARGTEGVSSVTVDGTTDGAGATGDAVDTTPDADGVVGEVVTVACTPGAKLPALNALADNGAPVVDFVTTDTSLEDVFVAHTGDGATESDAAETGEETTTDRGTATADGEAGGRA